jgi:hypothetical protein
LSLNPRSRLAQYPFLFLTAHIAADTLQAEKVESYDEAPFGYFAFDYLNCVRS